MTTGISPYVYCYNNPIRNPDGMLAYGNDYKEKKDYRHPEGFIVNRTNRFDNGKYGMRLPMHRPMYIGGPGLKRWLTKIVKGGKDYTVGQARKIWNNFKPSVDEIDIAEIPGIATREASSDDDATNSGGEPTKGNAYGDTFSERVTNPDLWKKIGYEFLYGPDDPNIIQLSLADNPVSFFLPFGQFSKASLGYKTLGRASKTTMVTTYFFKEIGVSGSLGGRWFTPLGAASNWETFLGRWTPFFMESGLIYDYTKDNDNK